MKKVLIVGLVIAVSLTFSSALMAAKGGKKGLPETQIPCPPTGLEEVYGGDDVHCFEWVAPATEPEECAPAKAVKKYDLSVELLVEDGEGFDEIAELSFNTTDREDGGLATDPDLCIAISSFVVYSTMTEQDEQFIGPARIRVKSLHKGRRSNNGVSEPIPFEVGSVPGAPTDTDI